MAANKTLKDIGIYFVMVFTTILIMASVSYPIDYLLTYQAAVDYNKTMNSFTSYIGFYLAYRLIFIMPVYWLFVAIFHGKPKNELVLKIVFIIIASLSVALISQSDMSVNVQSQHKRFITYPISGLISFAFYATVFYRNQK